MVARGGLGGVVVVRGGRRCYSHGPTVPPNDAAASHETTTSHSLQESSIQLYEGLANLSH